MVGLYGCSGQTLRTWRRCIFSLSFADVLDAAGARQLSAPPQYAHNGGRAGVLGCSGWQPACSFKTAKHWLFRFLFVTTCRGWEKHVVQKVYRCWQCDAGTLSPTIRTVRADRQCSAGHAEQHNFQEDHDHAGYLGRLHALCWAHLSLGQRCVLPLAMFFNTHQLTHYFCTLREAAFQRGFLFCRVWDEQAGAE